jgi:hypothetical protein
VKTIFPLALILVASCSANREPRKFLRSYASVISELPRTVPGEVWGPEQERQAEIILDDTLRMLEKDSAGDKFIRRDAHPKTHACVRAKFKINPALLPKGNQKGLFEKKANYDAWIRFSNGSGNGEAKHDLEKDVRGMAIKLMNVERTPTGTHDFLLANMKEFFSKDGDDYADLVRTASKGSGFDLAIFAITHPMSAKRLYQARIQIGNPLKQDYHSAVPFLLGSHSARYHVLPCDQSKDPIPDKESAPRDYLRQRLAETLKAKSMCFNFYVQPNIDFRKNLIEDPRLEWDEKTSPLIKVAEIEIPKQSDVTSPALINFCENARFNPWHAKDENRPLGQINRIRALVYKEISRFRHEKNRIREMEPVNHNPCVGKTAEMCRKP